MTCPECAMLNNQVDIAREEAEKLRDRIAADLSAGHTSPQSMKSLQAAERALERAIASLERHMASGHRQPGSARQSHAFV